MTFFNIFVCNFYTLFSLLIKYSYLIYYVYINSIYFFDDGIKKENLVFEVLF